MKIAQLRGLVLEEVVLKLLAVSGYQPIWEKAEDDTLSGDIGTGLRVVGRGAWHQVDAIADYRIGRPFSHPQRLLVEAKWHKRPVGLPVLRGVVGLLTDVSEWWNQFPLTSRGAIAAPTTKPRVRYHYQAAAVSVSGFSADAQTYAFCHDIHLFVMSGFGFGERLIRTVEEATSRPFENADSKGNIHVDMASLRERIRLELVAQGSRADVNSLDWLEPVVRAVNGLGSIVVGMIGREFPIFMLPNPDVQVDQLSQRESVRITITRKEDRYQALVRGTDNVELFSFEIPRVLTAHYFQSGLLDKRSAAQLKRERLNEITAIVWPDDHLPRFLRFRLDDNWWKEVEKDLARN